MNKHINEIRTEYQKIDRDWLKLHYRTTAFLVFFALIIEIVMAFVIIGSDIISTSVPMYLFKFMIFPTLINMLCLLVDTIIFYSKRISQNIKIYTVSISMVVICFVLYTVHSFFAATSFMYAVAILLTAVYTNYRVTYLTSVLSLTSLLLSELFIQWDVDKVSIFKDTARFGEFLVAIAVLASFSFVSIVQIGYERKKNEASILKEIERQNLKEKIHIDEITGLLNRTALHEALKEFDTDNPGDDFVFAIADIDNFKKVNDEFGHHIGDHCLIEFAKILNDNLEKSFVFRYGGDEFCLILRNTEINTAISICEKIQKKIQQIEHNHHHLPKFTVSFGLAEYMKEMNSVQLFVNADNALYKAKRERNSISIFSPE